METQWSRLLKQSSPEQWETIARSYWRPVFRHIRRHWRKSAEDARDLTQSFFLALMESSALEDIHPARGRLRHYIKACLEHFMSSAWRSDRALKRGGRSHRVSLDFIQDVPASDSFPRNFEEEWRREVLKGALIALEEEYRKCGNKVPAEIFREYYVTGGATYRSLALRHGLSEDDVDNSLRRTRARFRALVVKRVRDSLANPEDLEDELRELFRPRA